MSNEEKPCVEQEKGSHMEVVEDSVSSREELLISHNTLKQYINEQHNALKAAVALTHKQIMEDIEAQMEATNQALLKSIEKNLDQFCGNINSGLQAVERKVDIVAKTIEKKMNDEQEHLLSRIADMTARIEASAPQLPVHMKPAAAPRLPAQLPP